MDAATDGAAVLLEPLHNSVTDPSGVYEVARHRCRSWFCPQCCALMGQNLRRRLLPILGTFKEIMMWTFTVDPTLFASPQAAFEYLRENRCLSRTMRDLRRGGWLHSSRWFCVIEWQEDTEMVHFHVLLDASYIPWHKVLESWGRHRPVTAGPVKGDRPAFGTVLYSRGKGSKNGPFHSVFHAACYVTKYLKKYPQYGFPAWVLDLGEATRVRRYSTSRGFWGGEPEERNLSATEREQHPQTYRKRVAACGDSVDVFEIRESDEGVGVKSWVGEIAADADEVLAGIDDGGPVKRSRRVVSAASAKDIERIVGEIVGGAVEWRRGGHPPKKCEDAKGYSDDEISARRQAEYMRNFDKMIDRVANDDSIFVKCKARPFSEW